MVQSLDKPTLLGNPLDVEDLQRMKPEGFDHCLEKFFHEPRIDMMGLRLNLPDSITPSSEKLYQKISDLSKANDKRVFVLTRATEPPAEVLEPELDRIGPDSFTGDYRKSLRAMSRLRKNERDRAIRPICVSCRPGSSAPAREPWQSGVLSYEATQHCCTPTALRWRRQ